MKVSELLIGKTLLVGVFISASIVLLGGALFLIHHGTEIHLNPIFFKTREAFSFHGILIGISHFEASSLIMLGLAVLFITQLLRVLLTAFFFLEKKEKLYFWASIFVFVILIYSIWNGID